MDRRYTCAACGGEFLTAWSDAEADAEAATLFGKPPDDHTGFAEVCDDCFKLMGLPNAVSLADT